MDLLFEKEVSWATHEADLETGLAVEVLKTKKVTFKELNRTDKTQHKLHFKIISLFENTKDNEDETGISADGLYDITVKAINQLALINTEFSDLDKKELLQDSIALLKLGFWLFSNKFALFFQKLNQN